jgi:hypothetical protein
MLAWMMYALTVSLLLTGAAACVAHCARQRGAPSRFIWAACIAASLLIPAAISSVSIELPQFDATAATSPPRTLALRDATPHLITPALFIDIPPAAKTIMPRLESALPRLWAALSLLLAAARHSPARRCWFPKTAVPPLPDCCVRSLWCRNGCCPPASRRSAMSSPTNAHTSWPATRICWRRRSPCSF